MSDLQLILVILGTGSVIWQLSLIGLGMAMLRNPKYYNVKIGKLPALLAVGFFVAAVLV